ncbi:MAG TPA: NAD(P)/FAD-dependent oxidoreductase [Candidatus Binatia bacterium]|nr:NAD(P)/FAD-dependent oxidoreductase [Candidatus Binatia bacterium]
MTEKCDVLVIGGGPAGSTAAALLAARGRSVVVIEKDRHPRFHIGESLLPSTMPLLERLGVLEEVRRIGIPKYGAEFIRPGDQRTVTFDFGDAWHKTWTSTFQVRRSEFDHLLLRNAAASGASIHEGCRVTHVRTQDGGADVHVRQPDGLRRYWRASWVIDASGRDALLATRMKLKRRNARHASTAIFGHFTGARRLPGRAEGNISIFWFAHGWFWFIPLSDGTTSVGAVCWPYYLRSRRVPTSQLLLETIALCPALAQRLKDARLLEPAVATGNYSYAAERMHGERFFLAGDAFAFIDPVFSSGVHLAMNSAALAADAIDVALADPAAGRVELDAVERRVRRGLRTFEWLIYRMSTPAIQHLFMNPSERFGLQPAMTSILAGDVYGDRAIDLRMRIFRALYYMVALRYLRRTAAHFFRRQRWLRSARVAESVESASS